MIEAVGKFTVAVPGTLVRATSQLTNPAASYPVHGVLFQVLPANVGRVYIGANNMSRVDRTGLFGVLAAPSGSLLPSFSVALTIAPNGIKLGDFYLDADTAGDGVIVTVLIA